MGSNDMLSKVLAGITMGVGLIVGLATGSTMLGFGIGIVAAIICWSFYAICKSIATRVKNKKLKPKFVFTILGVVVLILAVAVLAYSCVNDGVAENAKRQKYFQEKKEYESSLPKCKNCGRRGNVVAGYGYCYDCYESFISWMDKR